MGGVVFMSEWYKNFLAFQRNPKAFIDRRKLTRGDFCMDMLKDLYSDTVSNQCKCHILLSLQEHQSYLIQNENLLEQVVGSLENLYDSLKISKDTRLLKSHVLVTMTTLLLTSETSSDVIVKMLDCLRNLLLSIAFNDAKDHVLRSTACQCLEEMETFIPGCLNEELDQFLSAVQNPQFSPVQNYAVLLSKCLKSKTSTLGKGSFAGPGCDDSLPAVASRPTTFTSQRSEFQIHHIVACIMDVLPSMSRTSAYFVLRNMKNLVEETPELLPAVFKLFLSKLIMSSDVLHFHLAFDLLRTFGPDLFSAREEKMLLHQLLVCIRQPLLCSSHHLMYLDWLKTFIKRKDIFSIELPVSCLDVLVPGPFDSALVQQKKISILCSYLQGFHEKTHCSQFLISCLMGLKRQALMKPEISTVSSFFQSLYSVFIAVNSALIQPHIQKLILEVMSSSPHLSPFVLDFLKCVKKEYNENDFCDGVFSLLVNHVVNLTPKQCAQDIDHFLPIFEAAVQEAPNASKPQVVLRQLRNVLSEPNILEPDSWMIGHDILSLCCTFLKFHDVEILYHDLGEVLNLVMKNVKNCDCQDRAKQYYAALTSLPQSRIKELFKNQKVEERGSISLTAIVSGSETTIFSKNIKLEEPVFELVRTERQNRKIPTVFEVSEEAESASLKEKYMDFINSDQFHPVIKIPFVLRHLANALEEFSTIYCVVITAQANAEGPDVSDIEVPVLTQRENNQGTLIELEFVPKAPCPLVLHFRAQFTSSNGSSYRFTLPSVILELQDFFSPIPISLPKEDLWKQLFDQLWMESNVVTDKRYISKFRIPCCDQNLRGLIEQHWVEFVMANEEDLVYYIGIFLPPSSHLLLRVEELNDATFATVIADKDIIPFISIYMANFPRIK